jgi:hypothetical protein
MRYVDNEIYLLKPLPNANNPVVFLIKPLDKQAVKRPPVAKKQHQDYIPTF